MSTGGLTQPEWSPCTCLYPLIEKRLDHVVEDHVEESRGVDEVDGADADGAAVLDASDEVEHPGGGRVAELREAEAVALEYHLETRHLVVRMDRSYMLRSYTVADTV